jgi:serine/threonine-protein kinase
VPPDQIVTALADRYHIDEELGRGAMGTVYLATDLRHRRRVALKVLRSDIASLVGVDRFLLEIRTTATLQHPNIVPLYDSGEVAGRPYYVMPFVEGGSLRALLTREGRLPIDRVAHVVREVGAALDYAHRFGVIHRDVKPENILMQEGRPLIADFGIALAPRGEGETRLTETGFSVGTPAYMSPEQAVGDRQLGPESDVYSLGCVCYELLTGERPVNGPDRWAPPTKRQQGSAPTAGTIRMPEAVDQAIAWAMAFDPADRPRTATAFADAVAAAIPTPSPWSGSSRRNRARTTLIAPLAALSIVAGFLGWRSLRSPQPPAIGAVRQVTYEPGVEIEPSLSPDGRTIAYAGGTPSRVYVRQAGSRPIAITVDSGPAQRRPRWSPDGSRIAFDAARQVFVVPALGGAPRLVIANGWSPTWSPDGRRIAFALADTIFTVAVDDGTPSRLALVPQPAELTWSPDGRWVALTSGNDAWDGITQIGNIAQSRVVLIRVNDGRVVQLTDRAAMNVAPVWSPDSREVLFVSNRDGVRDVYAVPISGDGTPLRSPIRLSTGLNAHTIALSRGGEQLVFAAYQARVNIWSVPVDAGRPLSVSDAAPLTSGTQAIEGIAVSSDRQWVYFTSDRTGNSDIWRIPAQGGDAVQLTNHAGDDFAPEPSPDGKWLAFYSLRGGTRDIWLMPTGPGQPLRLTDDPGDEYAPHWSPDGQSLCYGQRSARHGNSARLLRWNGADWGRPIILRGGTGAENNVPGCAGWAPDGRHLVVQEQGRVALLPVDGGPMRVIYTPDPAQKHPTPLYVQVEPTTGAIYLRHDAGIMVLGPGARQPREVVRFDDPVRQPTRIEMDADGQRVYFSLGDPQSDLFMAELLVKR